MPDNGCLAHKDTFGLVYTISSRYKAHPLTHRPCTLGVKVEVLQSEDSEMGNGVGICRVAVCQTQHDIRC